MQITPDATVISLLHYWQESLWQTNFNRLPLAKHFLEDSEFIEVSREELALGKLEKAISFEKSWIAPFVFEHATNKTYWIPLWLPAHLQAHEIILHKDCLLPWIPLSQFDETNAGRIFCEGSHLIDDWLVHECLTEKNTWQFDCFAYLYQESVKLLDKLSEGKWQQYLTHQDFTLKGKALIVNQESLFNFLPDFSGHFLKQLHTQAINPLLAQFAMINEAQPEPEFSSPELLKQSAYFCGASSQAPLANASYHALIHALLLKTDRFLAIKTPVGKEKKLLREALISAQLVKAARDDAIFPEIYLLTRDIENTTFQFSGNPPSCENISLPELRENLKENFQHLQSGVDLALAVHFPSHCEELDLAEDESLEAYIESLQQQDEKEENALTQIMSEQNRMQEKKQQSLLLVRWLKQLFQSKQTRLAVESAEKKLYDKIRKIKVSRAKIHRDLIKAIEAQQVYQNLLKRWKAWCASYHQANVLLDQNEQNDYADFRLIQNQFGFKNFQIACRYWDQHPQKYISVCDNHDEFSFSGWSLFKLTFENTLCWKKAALPSHVAYLILDEANRLLPQEVAPLLARSTQALFLGDHQDLVPQSFLTPFQEEKNLNRHGFFEEETLEQLHYKGLLSSGGNALLGALTNNAYQQYEYGAFISTLSLPKKQSPKINFISIQGKSEIVNGSRANPLEAQSVVKWVQQGDLKSMLDNVLILTPFNAQKKLIEQMMAQEGLICQVVLFEDLPARDCANIIFSPVYTKEDRRPFLFDQGEHYLYSALARTQGQFWVIGDEAIFDPKKQCPSGKLAKHISQAFAFTLDD